MTASAAGPAEFIGKQAPDFALPDLSGQVIRLADFKGRIVLLDFWATWCGPCRRETPEFIELQKKFARKGFTVIGIAWDEEGRAVVGPYARNLGINYPVMVGTPQVSQAYGGIQAFPMVFLIGRDGRVRQTFEGAQDKSIFEKAIRSAMRP
jgi:cytochrome c biogenesis protein CcmG/thiol:disulfide interchange protein DsbE